MNALTAVIDASVGVEPGSCAALWPLAGLPLLARTLEALEVAGFRKVVVLAGRQGEKLRRALAVRPPRVLVEVLDAPADAEAHPLLAAREGLTRPFLYLPGNLLLTPAVVDALQSTELPVGAALLAVDRGQGAWDKPGRALGVRVHGAAVAELTTERGRANGRFLGAAVLPPALLEDLATGERMGDGLNPLETALAVACREGRAVHADVVDQPWLALDAPGTRARAEEALLRGSTCGEPGRPAGPLGRLRARVNGVLAGRLRVGPGVAAAGAGLLTLLGALLIVEGAFFYLWAVLGALLALAGSFLAGCARDLTRLGLCQTRHRARLAAAQEDVAGALGLLAVGTHLFLKTGAHLPLGLALLALLFLAYHRYVLYFDLVRRRGGILNRARFAWWFVPQGDSTPRQPLHRALLLLTRWELVGAGLLTLVLLGLPFPALGLALLASMALFLLSLAHQIRLEDL
jgi:choline kinase